MIRKIFIAFGIILCSLSASAQWITVGQPDFADEQTKYIYIAVAPNGDPYVVFRDNGGVVKKFDGTHWVNVGTPFSSGIVYCTTMAFNSEGTPYIAYMDADDSSKATVKKI